MAVTNVVCVLDVHRLLYVVIKCTYGLRGACEMNGKERPVKLMDFAANHLFGTGKVWSARVFNFEVLEIDNMA